jgi:hypothetical protein
VCDRRLGMDRPIARRDFLNGIAIAAGSAAALMAGASATGAAAPPVPYPARLTGLRGSHPGSFEVAHRLRDGDLALQTPETAETYDLVIVGAGISGLSAAWFYRERDPLARILIQSRRLRRPCDAQRVRTLRAHPSDERGYAGYRQSATLRTCCGRVAAQGRR